MNPSEASVAFSPLQRHSWEKHGYAILTGVIPPAVTSSIHNFLSRNVDEMLTKLEPFGVPKDVKRAGSAIANLMNDETIEIPQDIRVLMTGHFSTEVRLSEAFWDVAASPELCAVLTEALGDKRLRMHMPPMARFVLPGNVEAGVPSHQDASYNSHMNDFVTVWMPLVEVNSLCGGVTIFKGRKEGLIPVQRTQQGDVWLEGVSIEGLEPADCVPMQPGDALIFNPYVVHRSMPNLSNEIRFSMDLRFFPASSKTARHYLDMETWTVVAPQLANV